MCMFIILLHRCKPKLKFSRKRPGLVYSHVFFSILNIIYINFNEYHKDVSKILIPISIFKSAHARKPGYYGIEYGIRDRELDLDWYYTFGGKPLEFSYP